MAASQIASALGALPTTGAKAPGKGESANSSNSKSSSETDFGAALAGILFALAGVSHDPVRPAGASSSPQDSPAPAAFCGAGAATSDGAASADGKPQAHKRSHGADSLARAGACGFPSFALFAGPDFPADASAQADAQSVSAARVNPAVSDAYQGAANDACQGLAKSAAQGGIVSSASFYTDAATSIATADGAALNPPANAESFEAAGVSVSTGAGVNVVPSASALTAGPPGAAPAPDRTLETLAPTAAPGSAALSVNPALPAPARPLPGEEFPSNDAGGGADAGNPRVVARPPTGAKQSATDGGKSSPTAIAKPATVTLNAGDPGANAAPETSPSTVPSAVADQEASSVPGKGEAASRPAPEGAHVQGSTSQPPASSTRRDPLNTIFANPASAPEDSAAAHAPAPAAPPARVANYVPDPQQARVANLQVTLGEGHNAQATIRETSGAVDVKIVAPDAGSAQRIAGEMDTLRNALGAAGLKLRAAQVNYRDDSQRRGRDGYPLRQARSANHGSGEIFTVNEVNE
jgi:hypothetical protein